MAQEHEESTPAVVLTTTSEPAPLLPRWLGEAMVLLRYAAACGVLEHLREQVRVPRGRLGTFEVCDFALVLIAYAVSGADTLRELYAELPTCALVLAAVWRRDRVPSPSALSRFLRDVPDEALTRTRQGLFDDLLAHGLTGEALGGYFDRDGRRQLVFDLDGTRQVARQRHLVADADHPPARRRLLRLCAPGYTGHKRGDVVRTRSALQQAHTREWLGTIGAAGNGDAFADLDESCARVARYMTARGLEPADAVVRLDGLYGYARGAAIAGRHRVGYLMRGVDYRMLAEPTIAAACAGAPGATYTPSEGGPVRDVFDIPGVAWVAAGDRAHHAVTRFVVTRRVLTPGETPRVGRREGDVVWEMFVTDRAPTGWSAVDLVALYFARGGFEAGLADEDREQEPDRWCSGHPQGQELWQLLSQWVCNVRLRLGWAAGTIVARRTCWSPAALAAQVADAPEVPAAPASAAAPPAPEPNEPPAPAPVRGEVASSRTGRGAGQYGGTAFTWNAAGDLCCPAGIVLPPRATRREGTQLRVIHQAPAGACRSCAQRGQCRAPGPRLATGRRVSVLVPLASAVSARPMPVPVPQAGLLPVWWDDVPGGALRRVLRVELHAHRLDLVAPTIAVVPVLTRARRAHRRRTWAERWERNARAPDAGTWEVTLHGVSPPLGRFLADLSDQPKAA